MILESFFRMETLCPIGESVIIFENRSITKVLAGKIELGLNSSRRNE